MAAIARPYYNHIAKSGRLNVVDTRIKRKDVCTAIKKLMEYRDSMLSSLNLLDNGTDNLILRFPPEIRNRIYSFALPHALVPLLGSQAVVGASNFNSGPMTNSSNVQARYGSTSILYLCKQITLEAQSLMQGLHVAYMPVLSGMKLEDLTTGILLHGPASLPPVHSTIFTALTSFFNVHIHLHIRHQPSRRPDDPEPYLDTTNSCIYGRLRQFLIIHTCASASMFQHLESRNIKRTATVHFDHLFSDWRHMLTFAGCYKFKHLIRIMGDDALTDWDLRYYVHAGGQQKSNAWPEWDARLTLEFERLKAECDKFPNIKLTAEVYGGLRWCLEGQTEGVTRNITPSSTLWPSWPDDVPWRKFERVWAD